MTDVPYSQEAEEAVIGAVLTNPIAYLNVSSFLKPDDFFLLRHTYIWEAMREIVSRGDEIDTVTLSERLLATGQLADVGGPAYFTQLISKVPTSIHAEVYGHLVERCAMRRRLMMASDEIKKLACDETLDVGDIFMQAEAKLLDVTGYGVEQTETAIKDIAHKYLTTVEELIALRERGIVPGLPTGFMPIDSIIGGGYKGELIVWAGPEKSGKSTVSLNIVRNRAKVGACVVVFSCEMAAAAITRKFISMEAGVPVDTIKNVSFEPGQYSRFFEAANKVSKWKLHIIDAYRTLTPIDVRRELRKIKQNQVIDSVLIDGLWLMESNSTRRMITDNRSYELKDVSKELVKISKEFNVPIDLVHQCNRAAESRRDKRFRMSDLSESAGAAQNAYTVIGLYRAGYYFQDSDDDLEVIVIANRDGNTGTATLQFDKSAELYYCGKRVISDAQPQLIDTSNLDDGRKDIYH